MLKQEIILMAYNKDVVCVIDQNQSPICKQVARSERRSGIGLDNNIPSHDPYIPRVNSIIYSCSNLECKAITLTSFTQVIPSSTDLKVCFKQSEKFECEPIRYNHLMTADKLVFLANHIPGQTFYLVDCLLYSDGGRVCHKKSADSHAKLVNTAAIARPKEPNILSQDEFICEESKDKVVNCDLDSLVPYEDGLREKESTKPLNNILLKSGANVVDLKQNCIGAWCGYSGRAMPSRRASNFAYDPPGGHIFKCYYAKKQQICKDIGKVVDTERDVLDSF